MKRNKSKHVLDFIYRLDRSVPIAANGGMIQKRGGFRLNYATVWWHNHELDERKQKERSNYEQDKKVRLLRRSKVMLDIRKQKIAKRKDTLDEKRSQKRLRVGS